MCVFSFTIQEIFSFPLGKDEPGGNGCSSAPSIFSPRAKASSVIHVAKYMGSLGRNCIDGMWWLPEMTAGTGGWGGLFPASSGSSFWRTSGARFLRSTPSRLYDTFETDLIILGILWFIHLFVEEEGGNQKRSFILIHHCLSK